ncbi:PREDICTED: uncharacterized protein LOC108766391 [Trachymyrmex cornetzi]|uniref:Uncharacterized protein n=1 Tax=Trachymyrmex cornetzi TaxID=471704 RepID=A0A151IYX0_9HYME|nr:PREDICTED: uncharacterized protein LOC108766391 [Trachymyrmex cornetzi]KYN13749.1 hypothetical protein ALC57_14042 [Trachymyrmex cornetzi]
MSCLSALHTQIGTLLSMPNEILLLRHKVFREYAKIAVGPDFIHTLPSFLILMAVVLILWKNPPSSTRLMNIVGATFIYKVFQVSVSWLAVNALLWLWLILQRILYCSVWHYWSYESEYRDVSYPWWQHVWSSYYPVRVQPPVMSAGFISWIIAMLIAITALGCANCTDRVETFVKESLAKFRNALVVVKLYMEWSEDGAQEEILESAETNAILDDGEISIGCDDGRSEMLNDTNNAERGDIHPISYGTNWVPQPNFSPFREMQRKISMKSFHTVTGANDNQDPDKFSAKQLRNRRGCHTVIPSNCSEQSSEC